MLSIHRIFNVDDFDYQWLEECGRLKRKQGQRQHKGRTYMNVVSAFDTETTRIKELENSVMYIWQYAFYKNVDDYRILVGRTWSELNVFMNKLREIIFGCGCTHIVTYVHNLSYEFQFLAGIFDFEPDDVFCIKPRKILRADVATIVEMRCSYLQTNMSLDVFTDKYKVAHRKLSGAEFDYTKERWWYTELSEKELEYCVNDVCGLCEAIIAEMSADGDNLYTIPLTSTGYVRRDVKRAVNGDIITKKIVKSIFPRTELYQILRETFRGGNTHANRFYADCKLEEVVHSVDIASSYPAVLLNCKFPMSKFQKRENVDFEKLQYFIKVRKKACVFRIRFYNIRLRDKYWGIPYLSRDKSKCIIGGVYDNGRVLYADVIETSITDIDFGILEYEYIWDSCEVHDFYYARYGYLPEVFTAVIKDYYDKKTSLKGQKGYEILYMKSKNKLNSTYGMCAQDIGKQTCLYKNGSYVYDEKSLEDILSEAHKKAFLVYQWGVWVTAHARKRLEEGIAYLARNGGEFVYADTDSIKYMGDVDFTEFNKSCDGWYSAADAAGKNHTIGVFEREDDVCNFKTLGAKKYCYEDADSKLHVTIAGVGKKLGAEELEEHGGVDAFEEGFVFQKAGGVAAKYNDEPEQALYKNSDGREIMITRNVCLIPSEYTLGVTAEYRYLLQKCKGELPK